MKHALTFIFGLILMVAPFVPTPSIADEPTTVTITGTILALQDDNAEATPLVGAAIALPGTTKGTASTTDGTFKLRNIPSDATLQISFLGYEPKDIPLSSYTPTNGKIDIGTITLTQSENRMGDVIVAATNIEECTSDSIEVGYINPKKDRKRTCRPKHCRDAYTLMTQDKRKPDTSKFDVTEENDPSSVMTTKSNWWEANLQCVQTTNCAPATNGIKSSKYELVNNTYICKVTCHDKGYETDSSGTSCHELTGDCTGTLSDGNIKSAEWRGTDANRHCEVTACKCGYDINGKKNGCDKLNANVCSRQTRIDGAMSVKRICVGETEICHAIECDTSKYELVEQTDTTLDATALTNALTAAGINTNLQTCVKHERKCTDDQKAANQQNLANAQEWTLINNNDTTGSQICIPTKCKCGYDLKDADTTNATCTKWDANELCPERPKNAADDQYFRRCRGKNQNIEYCHIEECTDGYHPNEDNDRCVIDRQSGECTPDNNTNVRYAKWRKRNGKYVCIITECVQGYEPNDAGTECVAKMELPEEQSKARINDLQGVYSGECTDTAKQTDPNVRYAKWQKKQGKYVCIITECVRGYEPNDAGTECVAKIVLPEDKSAERINELQGVYNEAKKNETSDANKLLGGASMGVTGAGGMMLGMGLAEQKADNAAYEQMRGYVSTFKCNYGANNVEYSVEPTQLPTSTELTNLYAEYVTLANDLKMRKSVLGLRAGLESQPILDSATSGLYDDVSSGRETGTFTSLARAILDPNGEDAKRWAEQTQKSKNLIIAGGVTAGVGVVGGIVGNVLINKDAPNLQSVREKIDEINKKYEEFYKEFGRIADDLDAVVKVEKNPEKTEDSTDNNSKLKDGDDPTENKDDSSQNDKEQVEKDTGVNTTECPKGAKGTYPNCDCGKNFKHDPVDNKCLPDGDVIPLGGAGDSLTGVGIKPHEPLPTPTNITLSIPGSTLFKLGKHNVRSNAKKHIEDLVDALSKLAEETKTGFNNVIYVTGYTDPLDLWSINESLSKKRARAVMDVIVTKVGELNNPYLTQTITNENTVGKGEADCTCAAGIDINDDEQVAKRRSDFSDCSDTTRELSEIKFKSSKTRDTNTAFPPCRRVEIRITLPEISAEALRQYGFTVGDSEISISDFIEKINQAAAVSTQ